MAYHKRPGKFLINQINLPTPVPAEAFFKNAFSSTDDAFKSAGIVERNISLTGTNLRLKFAGESLMPLVLPAISHLILDETDLLPDYTIFIWDSASTGIPLPEFSGSIHDIEIRGEIADYNNSRFRAAYFTHARMLSLLDTDQKKGIVCLADFNGIPAFEMACPLRSIFNWITSLHRSSLVHAAAVGDKNGAVLIGGRSGSGKSSSALRCLIAGMDYLGDDICAVSVDKGIPTVHSVYSSGKTHSRDLENFPELRDIAVNKTDAYFAKEIYLFYPHYKEHLALKRELKAVIIPEFSDNPYFEFHKTSLAPVLSILCSSTKELFPATGNDLFFTLSAIFRKVPCYRLNLGRDPDSIPKAIKKVIHNPREVIDAK